MESFQLFALGHLMSDVLQNTSYILICIFQAAQIIDLAASEYDASVSLPFLSLSLSVTSSKIGSTLQTGRQQCVKVVSSCTVDTEVYTCTNHLL